jgi:hypothetical protein
VIGSGGATSSGGTTSATGGIGGMGGNGGAGGSSGSGGIGGTSASGGTSATATDAGAPDAPNDAAAPDAQNDGLALSCAIFSGGSGTEWTTPNFGTLGPYCFVTCDDIAGWMCASFDGRTVNVNGVEVTCGATIAKVDGRYQFRVTAGQHDYATITWWGTSHACTH